MSAPQVVVLDGRQTQAVTVGRDELALLAERCDPRKLTNARSIYLALLEAQGSTQGWTKKTIAARAGVSVALYDRTFADLERWGFATYRDDGMIQLGSGFTAPMRQVDEPDEIEPEPTSELDERARKMWRWHAEIIERIEGRKPRGDKPQMDAAKRILRAESDAAVIRERLEYALADAWFSDKVTTMVGFDRWWGKIAANVAARTNAARTNGNGRAPLPTPEPVWRSVSYESDRVKIS